MGIVEGLEKALKMKKNGNLILPDPEDPKVQEEYLAGRGPHFRDYNRLPMWTEEYLCRRIESCGHWVPRTSSSRWLATTPRIWRRYCASPARQRWIWSSFDGSWRRQRQQPGEDDE